jgi:hypothetical protein
MNFIELQLSNYPLNIEIIYESSSLFSKYRLLHNYFKVNIDYNNILC